MAFLYRASSMLNQIRISSKGYPKFIVRNMSSLNDKPSEEIEEKIKISFVQPNGTKKIVNAEPEKSLYDVVVENNLDFDGFGSCGATLCCTTCHLIINEKDFDNLIPPTEEELNMLDLADGLTDNSRLGCQVILPKKLKTLEVQVPASLTDARG